jgi:hypothetical protein
MDKDYIRQQIKEEIKEREEEIKRLWKDFKGGGYFFIREREDKLKAEIRGLNIALTLMEI